MNCRHCNNQMEENHFYYDMYYCDNCDFSLHIKNNKNIIIEEYFILFKETKYSIYENNKETEYFQYFNVKNSTPLKIGSSKSFGFQTLEFHRSKLLTFIKTLIIM